MGAEKKGNVPLAVKTVYYELTSLYIFSGTDCEWRVGVRTCEIFHDVK